MKVGILVVNCWGIRKYGASYILSDPANSWIQLVLYGLVRGYIYKRLIVHAKLQGSDRNASTHTEMVST